MTGPVDPVDPVDPVVRDALAGLPVPPAGPDFWSRFDARLADAEAPTRGSEASDDRSGADAPRVTDLTVVPLARRRADRVGGGRNRWYAAAAVAAAVVVAVALAWRPSGDGERVASEPLTTSSTADPAASALGTLSLTADTPEGALRLWFDAIHSGDLDAAAALTGPATIAYELANTERAPTEFLAGYAEGRRHPLQGEGAGTLRSIAVGEFRGQAAQVVVLTRPDEGTNPPSEVYPVVRSAAGSWLIEPSAFSPETGGRLELVTPEPGESGLQAVAAGTPIELVADGDGTYVVAVDDRVATRHPVSEAVGGRIRADATDGLAPGGHLLLIVRIDDDVFTAGAFQLNISAP